MIEHSFQEVMRQARRMCKTESMKGNDCRACPRHGKSCLPKTHSSFKPGDDEEYERDVMKWAEEHPEQIYPTWNETWHQLFPNAKVNKAPCLAYFYSQDEINVMCSYNCNECRNKPIPAEIAEKFGVKPIGGDETCVSPKH